MRWATTRCGDPTRIAAIDFETTGLNPGKDRIVSVGVTLFDDGIRKQTFESYVNPEGMQVPAAASRVNGIVYEKHLYNAPLWDAIGPELAHLTIDRHIVAHKLPFDAAFWLAECKRFGLPIQKRGGICSKVLSSCVGFNGRASGLSEVAKALRISETSDNPSYHCGGYDAAVAGQIAVQLIKLLGGYNSARSVHDKICADGQKLRQLMGNITDLEMRIYKAAVKK